MSAPPPAPRGDLIDLSQNNAWPIDAARISASGVRGIIARSHNGSKPDTKCARFVAEAHRVGLFVGTYAYALPSRELGSAEAQAACAVEGARDAAADVLAVDLEESGGLTPAELAGWLVRWLGAAADLSGRKPVVYTGGTWDSMMGAHGALFSDYGLWFAQYGVSYPSVPGGWLVPLLWQAAGNTIVRLPDGKQAWGPLARDLPGAVVIANPGACEGVRGEVDVDVLGPAATLEDLRAGRQPRCTPDLSTPLGRQQALRALGGSLALDGQWGPRSRAALVLAQRRLGVNPDGIWGERTRAAVTLALEDLRV